MSAHQYHNSNKQRPWYQWHQVNNCNFRSIVSVMPTKWNACSLDPFLSLRYLDLPVDLLILWTWLEKFLRSHEHWFFYFGGYGKKIGMKASQRLEKLFYASQHILSWNNRQVFESNFRHHIRGKMREVWRGSRGLQEWSQKLEHYQPLCKKTLTSNLLASCEK